MARTSLAVDLAALPPEGTEAAARLASIRQALQAADMIAGKTSVDLACPVDFTEVWPALPPSTKRCFAARSERVVNAAAGGLELYRAGPISAAAAERLRAELREGLAHLEGLFAGR